MSDKSNTRPGVMIYFDDFRPIENFLDDEQLGVLLRAILSYAEYGEWIEDECDSSVQFALNTLRSKIDRDAERYDRLVLQRKHAAYSREQKRQGNEPLSFDDWLDIHNTLHS